MLEYDATNENRTYAKLHRSPTHDIDLDTTYNHQNASALETCHPNFTSSISILSREWIHCARRNPKNSSIQESDSHHSEKYDLNMRSFLSKTSDYVNHFPEANRFSKIQFLRNVSVSEILVMDFAPAATYLHAIGKIELPSNRSVIAISPKFIDMNTATRIAFDKISSCTNVIYDERESEPLFSYHDLDSLRPYIVPNAPIPDEICAAKLMASATGKMYYSVSSLTKGFGERQSKQYALKNALIVGMTPADSPAYRDWLMDVYETQLVPDESQSSSILASNIVRFEDMPYDFQHASDRFELLNKIWSRIIIHDIVKVNKAMFHLKDEDERIDYWMELYEQAAIDQILEALAADIPLDSLLRPA